MKFLSLQPFVPSGNDFEGSKEFFQQLGFNVRWDAGVYVAFEKMDVNLSYRNSIIKNLRKIL